MRCPPPISMQRSSLNKVSFMKLATESRSLSSPGLEAFLKLKTRNAALAEYPSPSFLCLCSDCCLDFDGAQGYTALGKLQTVFPSYLRVSIPTKGEEALKPW